MSATTSRYNLVCWNGIGRSRKDLTEAIGVSWQLYKLQHIWENVHNKNRQGDVRFPSNAMINVQFTRMSINCIIFIGKRKFAKLDITSWQDSVQFLQNDKVQEAQTINMFCTFTSSVSKCYFYIYPCGIHFNQCYKQVRTKTDWKWTPKILHGTCWWWNGVGFCWILSRGGLKFWDSLGRAKQEGIPPNIFIRFFFLRIFSFHNTDWNAVVNSYWWFKRRAGRCAPVGGKQSQAFLKCIALSCWFNSQMTTKDKCV